MGHKRKELNPDEILLNFIQFLSNEASEGKVLDVYLSHWFEKEMFQKPTIEFELTVKLTNPDYELMQNLVKL